MASLESVYHDFPRLAKQSGFHFQLHRGKVNWSEIENLDLNDIIENENYKLLEQNLANVINCNLEEEYDLNILDKNFVKLFKIAQLGVDYLSYFQIYLDKCVILLQEQLIAFKEEVDSLKQKEQSKNENKNLAQSYQCEKCKKIFISDVYLKFHYKRRHSKLSNSGKLEQKFNGSSQEIEKKNQHSVFTQTQFHDETITVTENNRNLNSLIKVEKLEKELQELKESLKKAETIIKPTNFKSSQFSSYNEVEKEHNNSVLLLLPFYLSQISSTCDKINLECQTHKLEVIQSNSMSLPLVKSELNNNDTACENFIQLNIKSEIKSEKDSKATEKTKSVNTSENLEGFSQTLREEINTLRCEKENLHTNIKKDDISNLNKPIPPPRKFKQGFQKNDSTKRKVENKCETFKVIQSEFKNENISDFSVEDTSAIIKDSNDENILDFSENSDKNFTNLNKTTASSVKSFEYQKPVLTEPQFKSFIKKVIISPPKLRKIGEGFKKSLNSRYNSVSTIGKNQSDSLNIKVAVVDGVNNHLRELGVDPKWTGIPKKTMKQKLSVLKHQRGVLSKENPVYSVVRQNLEGKIIQKLKKRLKKNEAVFSKKKNNQRLMNLKAYSSESISVEGISDVIRIKSAAISSIDSDSESAVSDSERNFSPVQRTVVAKKRENFSEPENILQTKKQTEIDFSVFQVGQNLNATTDDEVDVLNNKTIALGISSDTESNFSVNFNEKGFKTLSSNSSSNQKKEENNDQAKIFNSSKQEFSFAKTKKEHAEVQTTVKSDEDIQLRPWMDNQKKVFFASYPSCIEELSDSPTDDFWPIKSDSEKDLG